ncbi:VOC family protein [Pseudonocardia kujensis]|uniref:VOC family protein n=1 Tax=Pseudonocardia kujensis TaxID=1128675 RepID=UPI001E2B0F5B|nr:VOC family protein [Pseudonocardia kujensis]MCE0766879.1 VOC family protein [Pseudonocardia kujensis]
MSNRLLAPLAQVELLTPDLDVSVEFAQEMLGLDVVEQVGESVYLRCWGDHYLYSLALTQAPQPGLGRAAWRAEGQEQMAEAVRRIEASGRPGEWTESSHGVGRSYRFTGPAGHQHEIFWDVERARVPEAEKSTYPERPQRRHGRGLGVRLMDHLTVTAPDVQAAATWANQTMGSRVMAAVEPAQGAPWVFAVTTNNETSHDWGLIQDFDGQSGRMHHLAFWVESSHELMQGAKFLIEHGHDIDQAPGQHGIGEQNYLYFRDPVGLRYELNAGGVRNYVPDWEPVIWTPEQGSNNAYRTEIEMPPVSLVAIPPGVARRGQAKEAEKVLETAMDALARS